MFNLPRWKSIIREKKGFWRKKRERNWGCLFPGKVEDKGCPEDWGRAGTLKMHSPEGF